MGTTTSSYNEQEYDDFTRKQNEILIGKNNSSWPEPYGTLFTGSLKKAVSQDPSSTSKHNGSSTTTTTLSSLLPPSPRGGSSSSSSGSGGSSSSSGSNSMAASSDASSEEERKQAVAALHIFSRVANKQNEVFNELVRKVSENDESVAYIDGGNGSIRDSLFSRSVRSGKTSDVARRNNVWCSDRVFILAAAMRRAQESCSRNGEGDNQLRGPSMLKLRELDLSHCNDLDRWYEHDYYVDHKRYLEIMQKVHVELRHGPRSNDLVFGSIETSRVPKNTLNVLYDDGKVSYGVPSRYGGSLGAPGGAVWKEGRLGRAAHGDRGMTPSSWSDMLNEPILLASLSPPLRVSLQIDLRIVVKCGGGALSFNPAADLVSALSSSDSWLCPPADNNDDVVEWLPLPIVCDYNREKEETTYSLIMIRVEEEAPEGTKGAASQKSALERLVLCFDVHHPAHPADGKEEYKPVSFLPPPECVALPAETDGEEKKSGEINKMKSTFKKFGLSLRTKQQESATNCTTHVLTKCESHTSVLLSLPIQLLSSPLRTVSRRTTTTTNTTNNNNNNSSSISTLRMIKLLERALRFVVEARQTEILASSMRTKRLDALYCVPSSLGGDSSKEEKDTTCRIVERHAPSSSIQGEEETEETYTLGMDNGSLEYGVKRSEIVLASRMACGERAYLNVRRVEESVGDSGAEVQLTLEGRVPCYDPSGTRMYLRTQRGDVLSLRERESGGGGGGGGGGDNAKEEEEKEKDYLWHPKTGGLLDKGAISITKGDVQRMVDHGFETGLVRLMPSLRVGDRVRTSESHETFRRTSVLRVNDGTYCLETSSGEERVGVKREEFFLERESELGLAQLSASHSITQSIGGAGTDVTSIPLYPTEPLDIGASVLVRLDVASLRPSSDGTLLVVDHVKKRKLQKDNSEWSYLTESCDNWGLRGQIYNAMHSLPSVKMMSEFGMSKLKVKTLTFGKRRWVISSFNFFVVFFFFFFLSCWWSGDEHLTLFIIKHISTVILVTQNR